MAGLRERQKIQRRKMIENAAIKLFESKGFDLTTIEEIAEEALVSPATIYNYYGTKGELLLALVAHGEEGTAEKREEFLKRAETEDPIALVSDIICNNVSDTLSVLSRNLWGHVVSYVATTSGPSVGPRYLSTIADDLSKAIEVVLASYMKRGILKPVEPADLAYLLTRLERSHFLSLVYLKEMTTDDFKANIAKDVQLLIGALKL